MKCMNNIHLNNLMNKLAILKLHSLLSNFSQTYQSHSDNPLNASNILNTHLFSELY